MRRFLLCYLASPLYPPTGAVILADVVGSLTHSFIHSFIHLLGPNFFLFLFCKVNLLLPSSPSASHSCCFVLYLLDYAAAALWDDVSRHIAKSHQLAAPFFFFVFSFFMRFIFSKRSPLRASKIAPVYFLIYFQLHHWILSSRSMIAPSFCCRLRLHGSVGCVSGNK